MNRNRTSSQVCIVCIVLSFVTGWVHAAGRNFANRTATGFNSGSGTFYWSASQQGPWRPAVGYRVDGKGMPSTGSQQRAVPTAWMGQRPTGPYSYQALSSHQVSQAPRIEVEISETAPYVQQTVLYMFRVVSTTNIQTIELNLPSNESVVFEKIEGPITGARYRGSQQEIVNEYRYALTPIRSGKLSLPNLRITGTLAPSRQWSSGASPRSNTRGNDFDVVSTTPVSLSVKPADRSVVPWLPLEDLKIEGRLSRGQYAEAGKPLTLAVNLTAVGADGTFLPSMEPLLQGPSFQAYRESSQTYRKISADGKKLLGKRTETYTLVPRKGRMLTIPPVQVAWWNIKSGQKEVAELPVRPMFSAKHGVTKSNDSGTEINLVPETKAPFPLPFWIAVLIIFGASFSFWFWLWSRGTRFSEKTRSAYNAAVDTVGSYTAIKRLAPYKGISSINTYWQRARQRVLMAMPRQFKLWYCVRCIDREGNPSEWGQVFKFLVCKHLNISQQVTLDKIADEVIDAHPRAEPERLRQLMRDLVATIYGSQSIDFEAWKRDFKDQLRPMWFRHHRGDQANKQNVSGLPKLNPKSG
jgi:hypothetical protein